MHFGCNYKFTLGATVPLAPSLAAGPSDCGKDGVWFYRHKSNVYVQGVQVPIAYFARCKDHKFLPLSANNYETITEEEFIIVRIMES